MSCISCRLFHVACSMSRVLFRATDVAFLAERAGPGRAERARRWRCCAGALRENIGTTPVFALVLAARTSPKTQLERRFSANATLGLWRVLRRSPGTSTGCKSEPTTGRYGDLNAMDVSRAATVLRRFSARYAHGLCMLERRMTVQPLGLARILQRARGCF